MRNRALAPIFLLLALPALADEPRVLELEGGERLEYVLRTFPEGANRIGDREHLEPTSALGTAKLVTLYLAEGNLEEASLLSNAPKARYARLRESLAGWEGADFERAYGRYFAPENRIVGEATIGRHRLLMWYLKDTDYLTAYYLVEVEGKLFLDDVPSESRARLRQVLEAYRTGRAK
jgi:hypothetical protein